MQSKLILLYGLTSHQLQQMCTYGAHARHRRAQQPLNIHQKHSTSVILAWKWHSFRHLRSTRGGGRGRLDSLTSPPTEQTCVFLRANYPFQSCDCQISKKNTPWPINQWWFYKTRKFIQKLSKLMKTSIDKPAIWTDPSSPRRIFPAFTSLRLKKKNTQTESNDKVTQSCIDSSVHMNKSQCPAGALPKGPMGV